MTTNSFFQTMQDGTEIFVTRWLPDVEPEAVKGIIQLSHGMVEHSTRYDRIGTMFAEQGYIFSAHDHRGHGKTAQKAQSQGTGDFGILADKKGFEKVENDVYEIIGQLKTAYPGKKVFLLGHSFGSFVSQAFIEDHSDCIDGCILCGTAGPRPALITGARFLAALDTAVLGRKHKAPVLNKLSFSGYNRKFGDSDSGLSWLSRSTSNVALYSADSWCGFIPSAGFFQDMFNGLGRIHKAGNMKKIRPDLPVFFIYGEDDPVGDYGKTINALIDIYKKNGMQDVSVKSWPLDRHELFNEDDSSDVVEKVLAWISARLD